MALGHSLDEDKTRARVERLRLNMCFPLQNVPRERRDLSRFVQFLSSTKNRSSAMAAGGKKLKLLCNLKKQKGYVESQAKGISAVDCS